MDTPFNCSLCNKSFDHRKSYLRHNAYCRKARSRVTTRKKACTACTKAKTRCDLNSPSCSRCVNKGLACMYEMPPPQIGTAKGNSSVPIGTIPLSTTAGLPDQVLVVTDNELEESAASLFDQLIPPQKTFAVKWFDPKFSLNRGFVLCTLKSWPYMLLEDGELPPFMHPQHAFGAHESCSGKAWKVKRPPLQNCVAIVKWYSVRDKENSVYVGNTIRCEAERLAKEYMDYDDGDAVAALQAMVIYVLLRIAQSEEDAGLVRARDDFAMIHTMVEISRKVQHLAGKWNHPIPGDLPDWNDWILAESLRRVFTVGLIVDIFFDISIFPVLPCPNFGTLLKTLALPCSKDLWQASSKSKWENECTAVQKRDEGKEFLSYADLMSKHRIAGVFDHWLPYLDGLGTVLMAAAGTQPPSIDSI